MLVWLEALTAKQALLMSKIAKALIERECEILVTTRKYDYTTGIFDLYDLPAIMVGEYGGETLEGKLKSDLERQIKLFELVTKRKPDVHVSFTSPSSTRVAYGLKIPILLLTDSPHSVPVNKLTIPLAKEVIAPLCTYDLWLNMGYRIDKFRFFDGVFEVVWISNFKPDENILKKLGLKKYEYIIVRPEEKKASYYSSYAKQYSTPTFLVELLDYIVNKLEFKIIFFPRYQDQFYFIKNRYGEKVLIPRKSIDLQSVEAYARAVITGGSTIAVEGALQGTPSITLFPARVETVSYLKDKGFPVFHVADAHRNIQQVIDIIESAELYRRDVSALLKELENPLSLIVREVFRLCARELN
ncbi:MAG: hypothetical protein DRJ38_02985 [Thermoprotei archaeon]|nr:MAG: hypothetical protein DRJ38_02985 [Thermoprotei archaeon]